MDPQTRSDGAASPAPAHPYLDWAIATNFAFLRPGDWIPLLVEVNPLVTRSRFVGLEWLLDVHRDDVRIAKLFTESLPTELELAGLNHYVILIRRTGVARLTSDEGWKQTIRMAEMGPPIPPGVPVDGPSPGAPASTTADPTLAGERVLIAVIDEGVAFAHPRFRTAVGMGSATRIRYVWQQDVAAPSDELTGGDIDLAVSGANKLDGGDEGVYRAIGDLKMDVDGYKPLAHRRSHGTNVLDLAAGFEPTNPAGTKRPIIVVGMPEAAVGDPASSTLVPHAYWGLLYIFWRALLMRKDGEELPVVVNISYGPHEGPHDGSTMFERFMDNLVQLTPSLGIPMQIVLAAGNYRQSRAHASFRVPPAQARRLEWRLQPCTLTPSNMEIWLPSIAGAAVEVTLTVPDGRQFKVSPTALSDGDGTILARYTYFPQRTLITLFASPTAVDPWVVPPYLTVPSGRWSVTIKNISQMPLDIEAWIKRSDTPGARRAKGRQSYFDDPRYRRFDDNGRPTEFDDPATTSYVKRQGTLSGIATGTRTFVIGAYQREATPCTWMPAIYSSEASVTMRAPDWLAPGDDSTACPGTLSAGSRSGSRIVMRGTSAAAPQAARYYADQAGKPPPIPPPGALEPVSNRVPTADKAWVAGAGLMDLQPPLDRNWGNNRP